MQDHEAAAKPKSGHAMMAPMKAPYRSLAVNLAISGIIMYLVMFTMINTAGEFFNNLNFLYMTLMMLAPMAILMLLMMGSMYPNRTLNMVFHAVVAGVFVLAFAAIRTQAMVGDGQFLRSMIPHHSGAILMCREASLTDPEIVALCGRIKVSQAEEVAQMKQILARK